MGSSRGSTWGAVVWRWRAFFRSRVAQIRVKGSPAGLDANQYVINLLAINIQPGGEGSQAEVQIAIRLDAVQAASRAERHLPAAGRWIESDDLLPEEGPRDGNVLEGREHGGSRDSNRSRWARADRKRIDAGGEFRRRGQGGSSPRS